jgi:hypothetical protein
MRMRVAHVRAARRLGIWYPKGRWGSSEEVTQVQRTRTSMAHGADGAVAVAVLDPVGAVVSI